MRQEVNGRKHQNPDGINEMPVKPDRLERGRTALFEVAGQRQPEQTCKPWKPVSVKNVVANKFELTRAPLWNKPQYSSPWPMMKTPPSKIVAASHPVTARCLPLRRQTSERQIVKLLAKRQRLKRPVLSRFRSCAPGPGCGVAL
jgi:hypothetical protein